MVYACNQIDVNEGFIYQDEQEWKGNIFVIAILEN